MVAWTREDILGVKDVTLKAVVDVPGWNGATVWLRTMTMAERDRYIISMRGAMNGTVDPDFRSRLLVLTICDADGNRLFTEDDIEALGAKSAQALSHLFNLAQDLNLVKQTEAEAVEDARKN